MLKTVFLASGVMGVFCLDLSLAFFLVFTKKVLGPFVKLIHFQEDTMHAQSNNKYFVVEGNIGAGKSTFLKVINTFLNAQVVYEPHAKWQNVGGENLLERFYADTQRWGYTFQTYAFLTRVLEREKAALTNTHPFQILERSVFSDRYCFAQNCFELGLMNALEWKLYQEWFAWLVDTYMAKPKWIHLFTDRSVCLLPAIG